MKRILLVLLLVGLAGCSSTPTTNDETKNWSAQKIYAEAKDMLNSGSYEKAIKLFETLEARYPYGRYSQQAQLEVAYAYYKDNEPVSAVAACDRFIKLHPNHPNVDYAYYLKGLSNFTEDQSFFARIADQDMTERDPRSASNSYASFQELSTRFPDSKYTPDAIARMKYLIDALAMHEVHVAQYYYKRGAYVAAANRAQYALKTYPQAPANELGIAIMVRSYDALGTNDLRDDALRVLKLNFPKSKYIAGNFDKTKPWWRFWEL
ncbi:outer membrane protein assembly factor BamD [Sulfuriferula nivalis]|uniref:Outer membrane protein assembly factor BamD n=1 Tax=Sulfuriferula nivalis TaxID=2675298 RepID=A0A809RKC1_9PROT|nr:outer membrane protein assembly factor BamD [Sulfuriferula nivalis]BBP01254.1 outer membrane protein assembly factor BamD [Sulfuriferula nivalis]